VLWMMVVVCCGWLTRSVLVQSALYGENVLTVSPDLLRTVPFLSAHELT
jgi:hypothetical protein